MTRTAGAYPLALTLLALALTGCTSAGMSPATDAELREETASVGAQLVDAVPSTGTPITDLGHREVLGGVTGTDWVGTIRWEYTADLELATADALDQTIDMWETDGWDLSPTTPNSTGIALRRDTGEGEWEMLLRPRTGPDASFVAVTLTSPPVRTDCDRYDTECLDG